ncbi:MAG: phosphatidylserine decarboxylase [Lachnospiraceae bacterium]|nr:phosphatidylserine decarboxylase [Lachnospiraceae bacterium]
MNSVKLYKTKKVCGKDTPAVTFLYHTPAGRLLLRLLTRPAVSKSIGFLMDCRLSALFIPTFIKAHRIRLHEYKPVSYPSFNAFFTREIREGRRPLAEDTSAVTAPCDGKLMAYLIAGRQLFRIKNSVYDIDSLLLDRQLADEFKNGVCLIFRLTPDDYHRYCYIDDGRVLSLKKIKGILHTVRPIAVGQYPVYAQNTREYAVLQTKHFGKVIQMEIGALFIGRIVNHKTNGTFKRGQEKGMFEFGGSTVILLFQSGAVQIEPAILENTQKNKETIIRMGNKIGEALRHEKEETPCPKQV